MGFPKWVDEQSKGLKILLFIPIWGWIIGFLYRLFKFIETKDTATLVGMILFVIPFTGFILSIVDLVTIITDDKIKLFIPGGENFGISGKVTSDEETKEETKEEPKEEAKTEETKEEKKED